MKKPLIPLALISLIASGCQSSEQKSFEKNLISLNRNLTKLMVREYAQYVRDLKSFVDTNKGRQVSKWTCKQTWIQEKCITEETVMSFQFLQIAKEAPQGRYSDEVITFSARIQHIETSKSGVGTPSVFFENVVIDAVKKRSN